MLLLLSCYTLFSSFRGLDFGAKYIEWSSSGNITYGFLGAASGFSLSDLHLGAGAAQINDFIFDDLLGDKAVPLGGLSTAFDTEDDFYAVKFGWHLYQEAYSNDKNLTVSEFTNLLRNYNDLSQLSRTEAPFPNQVNHPAWPYSPGYFNGPKKPKPAFYFPSFK